MERLMLFWVVLFSYQFDGVAANYVISEIRFIYNLKFGIKSEVFVYPYY